MIPKNFTLVFVVSNVNNGTKNQMIIRKININNLSENIDYIDIKVSISKRKILLLKLTCKLVKLIIIIILMILSRTFEV